MAKRSQDTNSAGPLAGHAEALLAAIVSSSDDAIVSKDLTGTITSWNKAAERIFGYSAEEVIGGPISIIIPPERGHEEMEILRRISRGERVEHFETVRICKEGRRIDVSVTISPLWHEGRVVGASKVARDITGQKRLQRELEEQRSRLHATLKSIGDAVIVTNVDGSVAFMNPVAETLTGWRSDEARNQPLEAVFNIVNETSRHRVENPATRALREGAVIGLANHTILIGKQGSEYAIDDSASPIRDSDKDVLGAVLVFRDVSGMRAAAEFRARLAAIVQSSDDAIVSKDLAGRITSWNPAATRLYGYSADEAIGRPISMLIPPDRLHEETEILARIRRGERVDHFETVRITKDRRKVDVSLTISPVHDSEGHVVGASKIARDITEQKKTERELTEARERLRKHSEELERAVADRTAELKAAYDDLEAFSYTVAHDLRSPVRAMLGNLGLLHEELSSVPSAEREDLVRKLSASARRLNSLIEDLLKLSGIGKKPLERQPTALDLVVRNAIRELDPETVGRDIQWRVGALPTVDCDPGLVHQAFFNLLSNAVKFTRPRTTAEIEIGQLPDVPEPTFYVRDNGIGFKSEETDNLFTPFHRLHPDRTFEGTGVGLTAVYRIITKHGGRIWAESHEGEGATFYFTLPSAPSIMGAPT
jgi:PAS domain S-box-containing protein